jgi:hypothetical protein
VKAGFSISEGAPLLFHPFAHARGSRDRWLRLLGVSAPRRAEHFCFFYHICSVIPMHGSRKELGKGLVERIKKDLGLR